MANEIMDTTSNAAIIPEFWSAKFYPTLMEKLPFNDLVAQDYAGEISDLGDTVNASTFPQFDVAVEASEGAAVDADSVTPTGIQLVIDKRIVKDFILTKKALQQSIEHQNKLRDLAIHAIMKKMQSLIIAAIVPSASAPDHAIAYDSGSTLALADILEAKELLDDAEVEELGRKMVVGSAQSNDLFNITGFTSRDFIPAGSPLTEGAIKTPVMGFDFDWTSEAGAVSYFFQPMFMQIAVQQNPEVKEYDLGGDGVRAKRVNVDVLMGLKQFSDLRVVSVS